jgi:acyl carrier protein
MKDIQQPILRTDIEKNVMRVLTQVLGERIQGHEIALSDGIIDDLGLDSLEAISFFLQIEDIFEIELDYDELTMDHLRSVREFCDYMAEVVTQPR